MVSEATMPLWDRKGEKGVISGRVGSRVETTHYALSHNKSQSLPLLGLQMNFFCVQWLLSRIEQFFAKRTRCW